MNERQMLIEGQRLIKDVGFTKGAYAATVREEDGSIRSLAYCAAGAVLHVFMKTDRTDLEYQAYHKVIILMGDTVKKMDSPHNNIAEWNDDPSRTKSDVLALYAQIIDSLPEENEVCNAEVPNVCGC